MRFYYFFSERVPSKSALLTRIRLSLAAFLGLVVAQARIDALS